MSAARAMTAVFLTFLHTRISHEQTFRFQELTKIGIELDQSTADTMCDRAYLTCDTAAGDTCHNIIAFKSIGQFERLQKRYLQGFTASNIVNGLALVDLNIAFTRDDPYAGNTVLTATGAVITYFFIHFYRILNC